MWNIASHRKTLWLFFEEGKYMKLSCRPSLIMV